MTEQDRSRGSSRPRPSYGLPGPAAEPGPQQSAPADAPPQTSLQVPPPQFAPSPGTPAATGKRRGLVPLLLGLLGMFVLAPAAVIVGVVIAFSGLTNQVMEGPTTLAGGTATVPASTGQMYIVYIPAEDADVATCTAQGSSSEAVTAVPSSSTVTFPDGSEYQQTLGALAMQDTDVTITCEGLTHGEAAYLGPVSAQQLGLPLLLGILGSVVFGVIGLALVIFGIVRLTRSRSA